MGVPKVDPDLCTGCGICEDICPDVFEVADDGLSHVIDPNACEDAGCCEEAAAARPGLSRAFAWLIATLVAVHACMALTRTTASLWVLHQGHGEWTVGVLLSLFAVAPIFLALWAGRAAALSPI